MSDYRRYKPRRPIRSAEEAVAQFKRDEERRARGAAWVPEAQAVREARDAAIRAGVEPPNIFTPTTRRLNSFDDIAAPSLEDLFARDDVASASRRADSNFMKAWFSEEPPGPTAKTRRLPKTAVKEIPPAAPGVSIAEQMLMSYGLEDSEVAKIIGNIQGEWRPFTAGETNLPTMDASADSLQAFSNVQRMTMPAALFLTERKLRDQYQFVTSPAMGIISKLGSDYAKIVGNALQHAEAEKYAWGQRFRTAAQIGYIALRVAPEVLKWGRRALEFVGILRKVERTANVAATAVGAATGGPLGAVVAAILEGIAVEAALTLVQKQGENAMAEYVYENARREIAGNLFDKSRVVNEYATFMGAFNNIPEAAGDKGFDYIEQARQLTHKGIALGSFGYGYTASGQLATNIARQMPLSGQAMANIAVDAQLLGVNEEAVIPAYASLSKLGMPIDEVSEQFTEFFAALSGDGTVLTSQLSLVEALSEFSFAYGGGTKYNLNAAKEMSKISQFLADTPIGEVQNAQATERLVQSVDDLLMRGATWESPIANSINIAGGISRGQAMQGITGDANLLDSWLTGLSITAGIARDSFNPKGELRDAAMLRFFHTLRMAGLVNIAEVQAIHAALYAHVQGKSVSEVQAAYTNRSGNFKPDSPLVKYLSTVAEQEIELSNQIRKNSTGMADIHGMLMDVISRSGNAVAIANNFTVDLAKLLGVSIGRHASVINDNAALQKARDIRGMGSLVGPMPESIPAPSIFFGGSVSPSQLKKIINPKYLGLMSDDFLAEVIKMSDRLGINPIDILALMGWESGFTWSPSAKSGTSSATGLIQFIESTAKGLGTSTALLAQMTAVQQLAYVEEYFKGKVKPGMGLAELYLAIFFPAAINRSDDTILMGRGAFLGAGYESYEDWVVPNISFDVNRDKRITRKEIVESIAAKTSSVFVHVDVAGADMQAILQYIRSVWR